MGNPDVTVAQRVARAACEFERQTRGFMPNSVTVVMSEDTLVITLHGALSPAEKALAASPAGASQVQEFHRQLFADASSSLRDEIRRIAGVDVREAASEVELEAGTVVKVFPSGTIVRVFLLSGTVPAESWRGSASGESF